MDVTNVLQASQMKIMQVMTNLNMIDKPELLKQEAIAGTTDIIRHLL